MIGELLGFLIFVHFIADFALQSEFMAKYKQESIFVMIVHCIIWTGSIVVALMWYKGFKHVSEIVWWIPCFLLFLGHYFSDILKCELIKWKTCKNEEHDRKRITRLFHLDQAWHLIQLLIVAIIYG